MRADEARSAAAGAIPSTDPAFHIIVLVSGLSVDLSRIYGPRCSLSFFKPTTQKYDCWKRGSVSRNIAILGIFHVVLQRSLVLSITY